MVSSKTYALSGTEILMWVHQSEPCQMTVDKVCVVPEHRGTVDSRKYIFDYFWWQVSMNHLTLWRLALAGYHEYGRTSAPKPAATCKIGGVHIIKKYSSDISRQNIVFMNNMTQ